MTKVHEEDLSEAIACEEARPIAIQNERDQVRERLHALQAERAACPPQLGVSHLPVISDEQSVLTRPQKVALFRRLFRGRDDIFPKLWINPRGKKAKKGYSLACNNEWVRGLCEKPRVKCGECPNQAFLPVTDQVVLHHLQGRHVIGVYPLLKDETCWFLAADFDKEAWQEDVAAFVETCHKRSVYPAIERSRSGNGAHVWFFFSSPIAASVARKMGCYFITETMSRRHQLTMTSYDRFFPNQDTMPRGGCGNLIALPLQHGPRQHGNTVFLGDDLKIQADQWTYLSAVQRLTPEMVEEIANEATKKGRVIGVRMSLTEEDETEAAPWTRLPSGRPPKVEITGPLPKEVRTVLAQRVFVEKTGLPAALLNQIKRLAAFQNPEFYKKQSMRLSTACTPRVIACAEDLAQHLALPRGCIDEVVALLKEHGIASLSEEQRALGAGLDLQFRGRLSAVQEQAVDALGAHDIGIFVAPPGVGKTIVGIFMVAKRARSTLILVHRKPLLDQWVAQLSLFLGIEPKEIGQFGGGKHTANGRLDVAMIQSLVHKGAVNDLVANYGHVIVDECHHLPASSFERVLAEVKARYVTGLTATPYRRDGHQAIIHMQCGPVRFAVKPKTEAAQRSFLHRLICRDTSFQSKVSKSDASITDIYAALAADKERNQLILDDVVDCLRAGRSPILLTERRDHLEYFAARLRPMVRHLIILQGGMSAKERRNTTEQLATIRGGAERLILATGRYIGEGFDDARLDTLFLALPVSWKGTLVQYTGRLHRLHPGKIEVRIFDYVDRGVPILARMFERRLQGYRAIGYVADEDPFVCDAITDWDEDALRTIYDGVDDDEVAADFDVPISGP